MSSRSKIVQATIAPIKVEKLRVPKAIEVDVKHPITMALMEQLPKLDEIGLKALKNHMESHDCRVNSMSKKEDVESWMAMVDQEIAVRKSQSEEALASLLSSLPILKSRN